MFLEQQNPNIIMISERPCDTEDWSNDAENTALITEINYIWKYFSNREQSILILFRNITVYYLMFLNQINTVLGSNRVYLKIFPTENYWM